MACREGIDPADFNTGVIDSGDDTSTSELVIDDVTIDTLDPDGRAFARFTVGVSNVNFNNDITFRYATANGTAIGGTHFVAASNILATIPAGDATVEIDVQILLGGSSPFAGTKAFTVVLSSPSNATIDDGTGIATILYDTLNADNGGGGNTNDWDKPQFTGWSDNDRVTYDQFAGCHYDGACTAFATAACMTALAAKQGLGKWRFNATKLFDDMGGHNCCSGVCDGELPGKAIGWAKSNGVQRIDSNPNNIGGTNYSCKSRDVTADHTMFKLSSQTVELGGSGISKPDLLVAIKKAIAQNGAVYMASIFYSNWNSARSTDNYILRPHGTDTSIEGHSWVLLGWDDNYLVPNVPSVFGSLAGQRIGVFRIQSSHGCDWGVNGRGYIPYSYLTTTWPSGSHGPRYRYWKCVWGGAA